MSLFINTTLTGVRPDVLEQTVSLGQSVQRVVSLTTGSNVTGKSVGGEGVWNSTALLVNVDNVELDGSVVLSLDDSVGGRALSWNVQFDLVEC